MSDQGYPPPGYGQGEQPGYPYQPQQPQGGGYGQSAQGGQWGDPSQYGQQPQGGQYGQPQGGQYGQPQGGQYGQPQDGGYGQPQYGQPQYGAPQGQPGYGPPYGGQPPYGQPPYGQPPYGPGGGPPSGGGLGGHGAHKGLLAGITAAVVAAGLAVGGYFLFAGGSDAGSPSTVAKKLLDAGVRGDVAAAKTTLCKSDLALDVTSDLDKGGRLKSYTIGRTQQRDSTHADVHATVTPVHGRTQSVTFPIVKEDGSWKVCITSSPDLQPVGPTSISVPSISVPSISVPSISVPSISVPSVSYPSISNVGNYCASSVSPLTTAETYVGGAELGEPDLAQGCVYQGSVPESVTKQIASLNKLFAPNGSDSGPVFHFVSTDSSTQLTVTVEQESDGKYYVTDVQVD